MAIRWMSVSARAGVSLRDDGRSSSTLVSLRRGGLVARPRSLQRYVWLPRHAGSRTVERALQRDLGLSRDGWDAVKGAIHLSA